MTKFHIQYGVDEIMVEGMTEVGFTTDYELLC